MEYIAEPFLHPTHPKKGRRKIRCISKNNQLNLLIALSDAKDFKKDKIVRLKDLINIQIKSVELNNKKKKIKKIIALYHSKELNRDFPIIQWVPEKENIPVSILKPDGSMSYGNGEISLLQIPMNKTIQFERVGFVNPFRLKDNTLFCYFTH